MSGRMASCCRVTKGVSRDSYDEDHKGLGAHGVHKLCVATALAASNIVAQGVKLRETLIK